jgi:hypothetical protein
MKEAEARKREKESFLAESDLRMKAAAAELGRRGGKVRSEAKTSAVRENGKLGGRPKKVEDLDMFGD